MKSSHAALGLVVLLLGGLWFVVAAAPRCRPRPPPSTFASPNPWRTTTSRSTSSMARTCRGRQGRDASGSPRRRLGRRARDRERQHAGGREPLDRSRALHPGGGHHQGRQAGPAHRHRHAPAAELRAASPSPPTASSRAAGPAAAQRAAKQFHVSTKFAVGNDLKFANATQQQGEVWKNVAVQQDKLSENVGKRVNAEESASSLQLALENPAVLAKVGEYEEALRDDVHTTQERGGRGLRGQRQVDRRGGLRLERALPEGLAEAPERRGHRGPGREERQVTGRRAECPGSRTLPGLWRRAADAARRTRKRHSATSVTALKSSSARPR